MIRTDGRSRPGFCSSRRALLLIGAWQSPRRPGMGRALQRHPFSGLVDSAGQIKSANRQTNSGNFFPFISSFIWCDFRGDPLWAARLPIRFSIFGLATGNPSPFEEFEKWFFGSSWA
ncbi:hypothetical protein AAC387_Pa12g0264 [Persea americana]